MKPTILLLAIIGVLLTACSTNKKEAAPQEEIKKEIAFADGWARPGKAGMMSAAYFQLKNTTTQADTIISASSSVSANTQVHLSYEKDGLMVMEEQEFVEVPANSTVEFKQGGLHIMLIQPDFDINVGDSVKITLNFTSGKRLSAKLPVNEPRQSMEMHH